jgi:hypothetical protein
VTQTVQDWAARAATLPAALVEATPRAVRAGAEVLEDAVRVNVAQATGGDLRLSRVRSGKGAAIALKIRTVGSGSRTRAEVVPTGPIMLIEKDTKRHRQPFSYSGTTGSGGRRRYATAGEQLAGGGTARRGRARGGRRAMNIPGVGWRMKVNHPGTKGKEPVHRAFQTAGDDAGRTGVLVFSQAVRDHLRS